MEVEQSLGSDGLAQPQVGLEDHSRRLMADLRAEVGLFMDELNSNLAELKLMVVKLDAAPEVEADEESLFIESCWVHKNSFNQAARQLQDAVKDAMIKYKAHKDAAATSKVVPLTKTKRKFTHDAGTLDAGNLDLGTVNAETLDFTGSSSSN